MAVSTLVGVLGNAGASKPDAAIHKTELAIAMSNSYTTGGEAVDLTADPLNIGLANVRFVTFGTGWGGYTPIWDNANGKIIVEKTGLASVPRIEVPAVEDIGAVVTVGEMFVHHD